MSDAAMTNMTDPHHRHIAVQKLANEGGLARERMQQEGETGAQHRAHQRAPR
jgi:hypothetical protein